MVADGRFWRSWGMMTELERRWKHRRSSGGDSVYGLARRSRFRQLRSGDCPSAANPPPPNARREPGSTIPPAAFAYRYKYGFGLNWEQEVAKNVGVFSRVGWNDGHEVAWTYTDANWSASLGVSVKGAHGIGPTTPSALSASSAALRANSKNSWRQAAWAFSTGTAT